MNINDKKKMLKQKFLALILKKKKSEEKTSKNFEGMQFSGKHLDFGLSTLSKI